MSDLHTVLYVSFPLRQSLMYHVGKSFLYLMPCDSCGHSRSAHKEMTLAVYFCSQCQKVESNITFPPDRVIEKSGDAKSSHEDLLSDLYYNHKAFNKR